MLLVISNYAFTRQHSAGAPVDDRPADRSPITGITVGVLFIIAA